MNWEQDVVIVARFVASVVFLTSYFFHWGVVFLLEASVDRKAATVDLNQTFEFITPTFIELHSD